MWYIPAGICFGGLLVGVWISLRYRRDVQAARKRVEASSRMIETKCGRIEYGDAGHGKPVLLIHGAGGDYDQGLLLGDLVLGEGFRLIAPSRFDFFYWLAIRAARSPLIQPPSVSKRSDKVYLHEPLALEASNDSKNQQLSLAFLNGYGIIKHGFAQ